MPTVRSAPMAVPLVTSLGLSLSFYICHLRARTYFWEINLKLGLFSPALLMGSGFQALLGGPWDNELFSLPPGYPYSFSLCLFPFNFLLGQPFHRCLPKP